VSVKDGVSCPGCGLPNYEGMCPHCRGDQEAYERELVPPFPSSRSCEWSGHEWWPAGGGLLICGRCEAEKWAEESE
jgi:hypothetical protein